MRIKIIAIGKTTDANLDAMINDYLMRIRHYAKLDWEIIPNLKQSKNLSQDQIKLKEGELILSKLHKSDRVILLDEKGKSYGSKQFAGKLQKLMNTGIKQSVFVIGGAYGFSTAVYSRADEQLSLSPMTFSHQMVRLVFTEQLYRAMTILRNEPYHHD